MPKHYIVLLLLLVSNIAFGQRYKTQAMSDEINTIQVHVGNSWNRDPIIKLNSSETISIGFDRLGDNSFNRLRYKIAYCNADWTINNAVSEIEYLDGFNDNQIDDYDNSINTTVDYTHFGITIPNTNLKPKLSGNYVVLVYEDGSYENILLTACFSVLEQKIGVSMTVSSDTDIDSNKKHQQVSLALQQTGVSLRDPLNDIKVFVRQNGRLDTERQITNPSLLGGNKIVYEHNRNLIFEAGNEYRRFELASSNYNGLRVDHIAYIRPYYNTYIAPDWARSDRTYSYDQDQNGKYIIRNTDSDDNDIYSDYFITHFTLKRDDPWPEDIYINGYFTDNTFSDKYKMKYDPMAKEYSLSLLLKQGLYNYQYLAKNNSVYSTSQVEGNYYETENEYTSLIYYRPQGQRYDALIGTITVQSRNK